MQTNCNTPLSIGLAKEDKDYLIELVNTNSQSKNTDGVNQVQKLYAQKLKSLGFGLESYGNEQADTGDLIIARKNVGSSMTLTTIGHADTVVAAKPDNYLKSVGQRFVGAGIADNKAGIFVCLKGLEYFFQNCELPLFNINFVSSPNEELGSTGFHEYFNRLGEQSQIVLGFEPSLECGSVIHSRNGNLWYRLEVEGQSFHAGRAHKGHMNAAHDLCKKIDYFYNQFQADESITMNVGMIEGGHSFNTICERIYAKIDTRFRDFQGLSKIRNTFEGKFDHLKYPCSKTKAISKNNIKIEDFCPPMEFSQNAHKMLTSYLQIISRLELREVQSIHSGGAADINHFSRPGLICFDGLGAVGGNLHRTDEYVEVNSLLTRAQAFGEFLMNLNESIKGKEHVIYH
jgi:glutamate carboxypeptidase